jgi:hypothetical protein
MAFLYFSRNPLLVSALPGLALADVLNLARNSHPPTTPATPAPSRTIAICNIEPPIPFPCRKQTHFLTLPSMADPEIMEYDGSHRMGLKLSGHDVGAALAATDVTAVTSAELL